MESDVAASVRTDGLIMGMEFRTWPRRSNVAIRWRYFEVSSTLVMRPFSSACFRSLILASTMLKEMESCSEFLIGFSNYELSKKSMILTAVISRTLDSMIVYLSR